MGVRHALLIPFFSMKLLIIVWTKPISHTVLNRALRTLHLGNLPVTTNLCSSAAVRADTFKSGRFSYTFLLFSSFPVSPVQAVVEKLSVA